jgi:hypothetical protein
LKHLFEEVERVRGHAELVVILAQHRIGQELANTPKASAGRPRKMRKGELPISSPTRSELVGSTMAASRLQRLAAVPKETVTSVVERIVAEGKSATVTAVLRAIGPSKPKTKHLDGTGSKAQAAVFRASIEWPAELRDLLDAWIARQAGKLSHADAIRQIVEGVLRAPPRPPRPPSLSTSAPHVNGASRPTCRLATVWVAMPQAADRTAVQPSEKNEKNSNCGR